MYHLDNTSGVPEMPEPKEKQSNSPRWFGESQEQGGISWPGADWFNTIQAELLNLLSAAGIDPKKHSFDQLSKAIPVLGDAGLRNDLSSDVTGEGADLLQFMKVKATHELSKLAGTEVLGLDWLFAGGYDKATLALLYELKNKSTVNFLRGSYHAGKNLYGIRNNACVTSFRAGHFLGEEQRLWDSQVTAVSNSLQLARYGSPDKVGAYGDISGTIQQEYQIPSAVLSFTKNGFYTENLAVLNNALPGMVVITNESPKKWNIIESIDKETGLITGWDDWADSTNYAMPVTGALVEVDPEGKLWTFNYNLILPAGARADHGVIAELGVLNANGRVNDIIGIDIVNLPNSTSDCDTGLLIRGGAASGSKGWLTGIAIRDYTTYALRIGQPLSSERQAMGDIRLNSNSLTGIEFMGSHVVHSLMWRGGDGLTIKSQLDPKGFIIKQGKLGAVVNASTILSSQIRVYRVLINTAGQTLTLPAIAALSIGHEQEFRFYRNTVITLVSSEGNTPISINGDISAITKSFTPTVGKSYILDWDGQTWVLWS